MKYPIIGFCDGDLYVFPAIELCVAEMETIDVQNGCWYVFDAEGQVLKPSIISKPICWILPKMSRIEIAALAPTGEYNLSDFEFRLRMFFCSVVDQTIRKQECNDLTISDLVKFAIRTEQEMAIAKTKRKSGKKRARNSLD